MQLHLNGFSDSLFQLFILSHLCKSLRPSFSFLSLSSSLYFVHGRKSKTCPSFLFLHHFPFPLHHFLILTPVSHPCSEPSPQPAHTLMASLRFRIRNAHSIQRHRNRPRRVHLIRTVTSLGCTVLKQNPSTTLQSEAPP